MKRTFLVLLQVLIIFSCEDDKDSNTKNNNGGNGENNGGNGENGTVYDCTDPDATNYNPDATVDDGSCEYAAANVVVGISFSSGDCNSCNTSTGWEGLRGVCYNCYQIVLDYSVENIGDATANNVRIRFKVEYKPVTNLTHAQTNWYSDVIDLNTINSGATTSGSIVALDYNYYDGTHLLTYQDVRVYLNQLSFDG